ncbi:SIMPL domain-containing protein [bacterium]|nr:SIMPL domain-containing protein [bacterium]
MKKSITVSALVVALLILPFTLLPADADGTATCPKGTLSVSYSTEKEVVPDTVEFSVTVKTSDKKSMQEASRKNKEICNKIYDYLKANINSTNGDYIKTANFNATPIYNYVNNKRVFDRYEVSNNIVVHTKSLDKVSSFIDNAITMGATDVNRLNFSLSNKDKQCAELLSAAAKQVKGRGNAVAAALGTTVTGFKSVNTSCSLNQRNVNFAYANMKLMRASGASMDAVPEAAPATNIEVGNITIYANVDATLYLK